MNSIPPRWNYADLCDEIKNTSDPEILQKIALKLLDENVHLTQENKKRHSALGQIHLLMHKLYLSLDNKMSETHLLKKCLAISQHSRDRFLKDFMKFLEKNFDTEFKRIFSNLSSDLGVGFLSQIMESASCNLVMARYIIEHHLNYKKLESELSDKPYLIECLGCVDAAIKKVMKVMKFIKGISEESDGNQTRRGKRANSSSMVQNEAKRIKMQGHSKYSKSSRRKHGKVVPNGIRKSDEISRPKNGLNSQTPATVNDKKEPYYDCSRTLIIKLIDVLNDPAAECDLDVVLYKQANLLKDIEEDEYKVVDDVDTSSEEDEAVSNDDKIQGNEISMNHKSHTSPYEFNTDEARDSGSDTDLDTDVQNEEQESVSPRPCDNYEDDDENDVAVTSDMEQDKDDDESFNSPSDLDSEDDKEAVFNLSP